MNRKLIAIVAPPAPKCFETRDIWVEYLISAEQGTHGKKRGPFENGKYRPDFQFCKDCPAQHAHAMYVAGRCDWKGYVANLRASTPTTTEDADASA